MHSKRNIVISISEKKQLKKQLLGYRLMLYMLHNHNSVPSEVFTHNNAPYVLGLRQEISLMENKPGNWSYRCAQRETLGGERIRPAPPRYNPVGKWGAACPDAPQDRSEHVLMTEYIRYWILCTYPSALTIESNGGNQLQPPDRLVAFHA